MDRQVGCLEDLLIDTIVNLDDQRWYVESLIKEYVLHAPGTAAEAVGVFRCTEVEPNIGTPGILKARTR